MLKDHAEIIWSKLNHRLLESVALRGMTGQSIRDAGLERERAREELNTERAKLKKEWKEFEERWKINKF